MNSPEKQIRSASAEVVGMALNFMLNVEKASDSSHEWCDAYIGNIEKMLLQTKPNDQGIYLLCIHGMQKHYPPISKM